MLRLLKGTAVAVFFIVVLSLFSGAQNNKRLPTGSFDVPVESVSFQRIPAKLVEVTNDKQKQE